MIPPKGGLVLYESPFDSSIFIYCNLNEKLSSNPNKMAYQLADQEMEGRCGSREAGWAIRRMGWDKHGYIRVGDKHAGGAFSPFEVVWCGRIRALVDETARS